MLKPITTY